MLTTLLVKFFDYKTAYGGQSFIFSVPHIIFIVFSVLTIPLLSWLSRKPDKKIYKIILIALFAFATVFEIVKISLEGYQDVKYSGAFFFGGLLPLYLCSMLMYVLPFAIWGKGKVRQCACAFLATFGIIGALANLVYANILNDYPLWSFAGMHSMLYHYIMLYVGISMWVTGYYRPEIKDIFHSYIPLFIFSVPVIIIDYIFKFDYMFYRGHFFPFSIIAEKMPEPVWTVVLLIGYLAINALLFYLPFWLISRRKKQS